MESHMHESGGAQIGTGLCMYTWYYVYGTIDRRLGRLELGDEMCVLYVTVRSGTARVCFGDCTCSPAACRERWFDFCGYW